MCLSIGMHWLGCRTCMNLNVARDEPSLFQLRLDTVLLWLVSMVLKDVD